MKNKNLWIGDSFDLRSLTKRGIQWYCSTTVLVRLMCGFSISSRSNSVNFSRIVSTNSMFGPYCTNTNVYTCIYKNIKKKPISIVLLNSTQRIPLWCHWQWLTRYINVCGPISTLVFEQPGTSLMGSRVAIRLRVIRSAVKHRHDGLGHGQFLFAFTAFGKTTIPYRKACKKHVYA